MPSNSASNAFVAWLFEMEPSGAVPHLPVQRCCSLLIRTVSGFYVVYADARFRSSYL